MSFSKGRSNQSITYILNPSQSVEAGHSLGVNCLEYSTNSRTLFSGGRDGVVSCLKNATPLESYQNYNDDPNYLYDKYDIDYNSANEIRNYISNYFDNEQEVLNLEKSIRKGLNSKYLPIDENYLKASQNSVQLHLDWINDMKLLSDDQGNDVIASCSSDMSVKLWNSQTNSITTLGHHKDYVKSLSLISNDKNQILSGGLDRCVNLWDVAKQSVVSSYKGPKEQDSVYALSSIDDLILSGGPSKVIKLFDRRDMQRPIKTFVGHIDNIRCLSMRSKYFLSGSADSTIKLWDLRTNRILRNFDMHNSSIWSLHVPKSCADNKENFAIFYSGDKDGLLIKTDLRGCISDKNTNSNNFNTSTNAAYIDSKFKETLGISTIIANHGNGLNNRPVDKGTDVNGSTGGNANSSENGILSIVEGDNCIWTSVANQTKTSLSNSVQHHTDSIDKVFIKSWSIPITNKFVLYQGIKLTKNLDLLNKSKNTLLVNNGSVNTTNDADSEQLLTMNAPKLTQNPSSDDLYDLVSQLSNDDNNYDFSQIDQALSTQMAVNNHLTPQKFQFNHQSINPADIVSLNDMTQTGLASDKDEDEDADGDYGDNDQIFTYFVSFNGSPSSEYVINDISKTVSPASSIQSDGPLLRQKNGELNERAELEILYEQLPENLLYFVPYNSKPCQTIKGTNAIIRSRFLNNRRHVAALDEIGGVIIFDIINCSIVKSIEPALLDPSLNIDYDSADFVDIRNDKFDEIVSEFQTVETLPQWCTVETKAGKLFITLKENNFTNCEIYSDDLYKCYPECDPKNLEEGANTVHHWDLSKYNIGKIVLRTLFDNFVQYESDPAVALKRKQELEKDPYKVAHLASLFKSDDVNALSSATAGASSSISSSSSAKKEEEKPKRKLFGRKSTSSSAATVTTVKAEEPVKPMTEDNILDKLEDSESLLTVLQTHLPIPGVPSTLIKQMNIIDVPLDEVAKVHLKRQNIDIVINDNTISKFHCKISELTNDNSINLLEKTLPIWASKALLLDKYPLKEASKIGFVIKKHKDSDLPGLNNGNNDSNSLIPARSHPSHISSSHGNQATAAQNHPVRLAAHNMLRVSKVLDFIVDKFDTPLENVTQLDEETKKKKPQEWLEVTCRNELIPLNMTLATVKATIWKSSSDVEFLYRRKTSPPEESKA